jgi:hypothetical protein
MTRAIFVAVLLVLVAVGSPSGEGAAVETAGAPESLVFGDADCSGHVDTKDGLAALYAAAGLGEDSCTAITDVQCDAIRDVLDVAEILRQRGGLGASKAGCPDVGTSLAAEDPDPLIVSPVVSNNLAVTETIGPDGGAVVATGANDTSYTLAIPAGAMVVEENVTLTPVASIGGLPLDGMSGAVLVGPDDLFFLKPVTLSIAPSQAPAGPEVVGFGLTGNELFLYPLLDDASPAGVSPQGALIRLPYLGPGGYGSGFGSIVDVEGIEQHTPTRPEDQLAQTLDELFRDPHDSPEFRAALESALHAYYYYGLLVALQYAPGNCDVTRGLLVPYLKWVGIIQGFLDGNTLSAERGIMENGLALGVANCFNTFHEPCLDEPDPSQIFYLMKFVGIFQSGIVGNPDIEALIGDYNAKIADCTPEPCQGTDCRWVGSAQAEVYGVENRRFSITVENIVFKYSEGQDPTIRYQSYYLASAGPMIWEASGTAFGSLECPISGTMTLDPPGIDGDYTHQSDREAQGGLTEDHLLNTYSMNASGHDSAARITISCPNGSSQQAWPGLNFLFCCGLSKVEFIDAGTNTIAKGEYFNPNVFGGRWTWDLRKVK